MVTKQDIRKISKTLGVSLVGITTAARLEDLPTGKVLDVAHHRAVLEVLPSARSAIILAYRIWDPIFNVVASGPKWFKKGVSLEHEGSEFYQLYSQVLDAKAWALALYLQKNGYESVVTRRIALKPAAIVAGLGCRGKNTLTISPEYGSYIRYLCGQCTRCIDACPTKALQPYEIDIRRCLTYAVENPESSEVDEDVRDLELKLIKKPSLNSFIECTICQDVCPVGFPLVK